MNEDQNNQPRRSIFRVILPYLLIVLAIGAFVSIVILRNKSKVNNISSDPSSLDSFPNPIRRYSMNEVAAFPAASVFGIISANGRKSPGQRRLFKRRRVQLRRRRGAFSACQRLVAA